MVTAPVFFFLNMKQSMGSGPQERGQQAAAYNAGNVITGMDELPWESAEDDAQGPSSGGR